MNKPEVPRPTPYRDSSKEKVRDDHPAAASENEKAEQRRSSAHIFDTLVESNLQLVKTLRVAITVMVVCGLMGTSMSAFSALTLRTGLAETRELIITTLSHCRKD
jgi:hypothetical protein